MTFEKLLNTVSQKKGYGRILTEQVVRSTLAEIAEQIEKGNEVKIDGFGTFKTSTTKAHRLSFNSAVVVPEKTVIIFSPELPLKQFINGETKEYSMRKKKT